MWPFQRRYHAAASRCPRATAASVFAPSCRQVAELAVRDPAALREHLNGAHQFVRGVQPAAAVRLREVDHGLDDAGAGPAHSR